MSVQTTTHLNFRGQAREALGFYHSVFGGEQTIVTYEDLGAAQDATQGKQIMWGQVLGESGFHVMAYDVQPGKPWHPGENAFYVSLRGTAAQEVAALWERLREGATILQPLGSAAWSPLYGMLKDRYGITWALDVRPEQP